MLQALIFLGVILLVLGPIHWYIWRRLVRDTTRPGRWRRAGTVAIFVLAGALLAAFGLPRAIGAKAAFPIAFAGYVWLAVMFYLLVALLVLELPRFALLRSGLVGRRHKTPAEPELVLVGADAPTGAGGAAATATVSSGTAGNEGGGHEGARPGGADDGVSRRLLLARGAAIFAGLTATGVTGYGIKTAYAPPQVKRIQIPLAKLPRNMDGYRIAVVADVHIGPLTGIGHTRRIVDTINGMDADLITMVGDINDGTVEELHDEALPLRGLRGRDGAFYVTGNHEYYAGVEAWLDEVRSLGMRTLENERLEIRGLDLAGVNDITGDQYNTGPDFAKALSDRDPAKPVVLLAHQPVMAYEAAKYNVDLQLSGHTHGGQIWPFHYIVRLAQPVVSGLGEVDGTKVYVTNGAGFWGPPVRVGAPPDVTLVELRTG